MKALLEMILQYSILTKHYLQKGICRLERRETAGTKIRVHAATDLNCKTSPEMSLSVLFCSLCGFKTGLITPASVPSIWFMNMLWVPRFALGSGHIKAEVKVNSTGRLWLWKHHGCFLARAHTNTPGSRTDHAFCSATIKRRVRPKM